MYMTYVYAHMAVCEYTHRVGNTIFIFTLGVCKVRCLFEYSQTQWQLKLLAFKNKMKWKTNILT